MDALVSIEGTDRDKIRQIFVVQHVKFSETHKSIRTPLYRFCFNAKDQIEKIINYETQRIYTASASYAWRNE